MYPVLTDTTTMHTPPYLSFAKSEDLCKGLGYSSGDKAVEDVEPQS